MITGAAQADAALLVVDGSPGGFEASFRPSTSGSVGGDAGGSAAAGVGQTREHVHVARSMGVRQLAVVVTKLDATGYDEMRFLEVKSGLEPFLAACGFRDPQWLPSAAPAGQNVTAAPSDQALASWWPAGCTVVDAINKFEPVVRPTGAMLLLLLLLHKLLFHCASSHCSVLLQAPSRAHTDPFV